MQQLPYEQGKFIVIEGLDGAGTTTQVERLSQWLQDTKGYRVYTTHEPAESPPAKWLRQALQKRITFAEPAQALLFLADRLDHLYGPAGFLPLLEEHPNTVVISDRYYLSSFAYQTAFASKESPVTFEWLWDIHQEAVRPHMTVFLDTPPALCLERLTTQRGYHFEKYEARLESLKKVRERYRAAIEFLRERGEPILVVSGEGTPAEIQRAIRNRVDTLFEGFAHLERLRQAYPLVDTAASLLEEQGFQIVGAREISGGLQLRVVRGDVEKPVTVNLYYAQGQPSAILIQAPVKAAGLRLEIRKALEPLYRQLADLKARRLPNKPHLREARALLERKGLTLHEVRLQGQQVVFSLNGEAGSLVVTFRYQGDRLVDISYHPIKPPATLEDKKDFERARQQAAAALEPLIRYLKELEKGPMLF